MPLSRVKILEREIERVMYNGTSYERQELLCTMLQTIRQSPSREWLRAVVRVY